MTEIDRNESRTFAIEVVEKLRSAGYEALWAGGCVRDQLMGREPKDYDVATSARPEQVREVFGQRRTLPIGAAFGVITVLGQKNADPIEVATFRQDADYSDGRHPDSVTFSTAEEDAKRRDFTINGLFYDPIDKKVIDYVDGQEDLQRKLIRAIGNPYARIAEDKLRMLRAVRFASTFDFAIDKETLTAIQRQAPEICVVSAERIASELRRMLEHRGRKQATRLLRDSKLLEQILPEVTPILSQDSNPSGDELWSLTLSIMNELAETQFSVALAVLLREIHFAESATSTGARHTIVEKICRRWKLSNDETEATCWFLKNELTIRNATQAAWPVLQRILISARVALLLDYTEAVARVVDGSTVEVEYCRERLMWPVEKLNPRPLLDGGDLKAAGLKPGPIFKQLLEQVRDAQLDGQLLDKDDAIQFAQSIIESSDKE